MKTTENMAIILVEQYFDFAFDLSDYIYSMKRGEMLIHGCTDTVDRKAFKDSVSIWHISELGFQTLAQTGIIYTKEQGPHVGGGVWLSQKTCYWLNLKS